MDRWLKRIWLVNGVALLGLLLFGLGAALFAVIGDWRGDKAIAVAAPAPDGGPREDAGRVRAVRFDVPEEMRGTKTRIVFVRNGTADLPESGSGSFERNQYSGGQSDGPIVNLIFLPADGSPGHLLFDRPAWVKDVSYPGKDYGHADSLQTWITYEAALEDSNRDGQLDQEDELQLFVSDLEGRGLKPVLPAGWRFKEYESLHDSRALAITAIEAPHPGKDYDERRAAERAFLYDVPSGRLQSFAALDSLVAHAGKLLGRGTAGR